MNTLTTKIHYHRHALDALMMDGKTWLRVTQLDVPLGYSHPKKVTQLFNRNRDEFTEDEARLIVQPTAGGPQEMRVFSLRGAELLAILSRTPEGKKFRHWILDRLEDIREQESKALRRAQEGVYVMPWEARRMLELLEPLAAPGSEIANAIKGLKDGALMPPDDPAFEEALDEIEAGSALIRQASLMIGGAYKKTRAIGASRAAVKDGLERRKKRAQLQLPLSGEG